MHPSNQDTGNWQGPVTTFQKIPLTPDPQLILSSTIIIYLSLLPPPPLFLSCFIFLSLTPGICHGCYCLNELSLDKDVPDGGKEAIRLSYVFYLSLVKEYCTTLFTNVRRGRKACLVCRDCGFLGQGGSQKPSKSNLWSLYFFWFGFYCISCYEVEYIFIVTVWNGGGYTIYIYFLFFTIVQIYWLTYVILLQSITPSPNKRQKTVSFCII